MAKEIQAGSDYGVTAQVRVTRPAQGWRMREHKDIVHDVTVTRVAPRPSTLTRAEKIARIRAFA